MHLKSSYKITNQNKPTKWYNSQTNTSNNLTRDKREEAWNKSSKANSATTYNKKNTQVSYKKRKDTIKTSNSCNNNS